MQMLILRFASELGVNSVKRIYAKLLATKDMGVKYKPKEGFIHNFHVDEVLIGLISRFLSLKFGMLSSSRCTVNTFSPSTMSKTFSIIRLTLVPVDDVASEHLLSSWLKLTRSTRMNFSLLEAGSEAERRISFFA
jgi:hypothetical protein